MNTTRTSRRRRLLAAAAAGALSLGAALSVAPASNAAPSYGNIDEDASGSIIVHKHENQVGTDAEQNPAGDGTPIPSAPVAGVEFTAYEILDASNSPVDLTVPSNWDHLENLKVSTDGTTLTGGPGAPAGPWTVSTTPVASGTTGSDGRVTLDIDHIGAYVVVETDAPAQVVQRAEPFVVTIPFPWEDGWLYDVHVYPKNGLTDIAKAVSPQPADGLGVGSTVAFPVTTKVPGLAPGTTFQNYVVVDTLDSRLGDVGVRSVTLDGNAVDAAHYDVVVDGQTVRVEFTPAGLQWLLTQGDTTLVTTFVGTVETLGDGVIENDATLFVNDPDEENGIDSDKVHTQWGDLVISKNDNAGEVLKGAEFEVYAAEAPYADQCAGAVATGDPISVNGTTRFLTAADGSIRIPGLFVSDSDNEKRDADQRCYVLKEVQAPAGFVTPTGAQAFTPVAVKVGATTGVDVTITNVQQDVPQLPRTGGQGRSALIAAGGALLAAALGLWVVNRRRVAQA